MIESRPLRSVVLSTTIGLGGAALIGQMGYSGVLEQGSRRMRATAEIWEPLVVLFATFFLGYLVLYLLGLGRVYIDDLGISKRVLGSGGWSERKYLFADLKGIETRGRGMVIGFHFADSLLVLDVWGGTSTREVVEFMAAKFPEELPEFVERAAR